MAANDVEAYVQNRNEIATVAVAKAMGASDLVTPAAYHLTTADGTRYTVTQMITGEPLDRYFGMHQDVTPENLPVSRTQLEKAVLTEYLVGMQDRAARNLLYDPATRSIHEIDFNTSFLTIPIFSRSTARTILQERQPANAQGYSRSVVKSLLAHQKSAIRAATTYGLSSDAITALQQRYAALQAAYDATPRGRISATALSDASEQQLFGNGMSLQ